MGRLLLLAIVSWSFALSAFFALSLLFFERPSTEDLLGVSITAGAISAPIIAFLYIPCLTWLRRRQGGCKPKLLFPLFATSLLNIPAFAVAGLQAGHTMAVSESLLFIFMFLVMGLVFGTGFVLISDRKQPE